MKPLIVRYDFSIRLYNILLLIITILFSAWNADLRAQAEETIYVATYRGLSISTDGGNSFINKTTNDGLGDNRIRSLYIDGGKIYVATFTSLSISADGGNSFENRTTADGLGSNGIWDVFVVGNNVYVATSNGLSISTDGGNSFTNRTTADGLGNNWVYGVFAAGDKVYAATISGLSISTNGGDNFINKTSAHGLGSNTIRKIFIDGDNLYAATNGGLSISTDGGNSFTNKTTAEGLGNNNIWDIMVAGSKIYAATYGNGLSISSDGGSSFNVRTSANGLGNNWVYSVFIDGSNVYAATKDGGLGISTDGGDNFISKTTADGLADNWIFDVFVTKAESEPTIQDAIARLTAEIRKLQAGGSLTADQADGLIAKLQAAKAKADIGNEIPAINNLKAFINQMNAFMRNGKLEVSQAQPLIDSAENIIGKLILLAEQDEKNNKYKLEKNYPNPFNPSTTIRYTIPEDGFVTVEIFNVIGEKVAELVNRVEQAGTHEVIFNSTGLPSGIYICRLISGSFVESQKMQLLK